jgi:hypothetical protein
MPFTRTLLAALVLAVVAGVALAAEEATRLLVEVDEKSQQIGPGESVRVQVVGESASGARVTFSKRTVELTATAGTIEVVKLPYQFRYTAPASVDGPIEVRLRARLTEAPGVRGRATIRVAPKASTGGYKRLILRTSGRAVSMGGSLEIEILGDRGTGSAARVEKDRVTLVVLGHTEPAGSVEYVEQGVFRYTAPGRAAGYKAGDKIKLVAALSRDGAVKGEIELALTPPTTKRPERPKPPEGTRPVPGGEPKPPTGQPKPPPTSADAAGRGLLLAGGDLRVMVWRSKATAEERFVNERKLPAAGSSFVAHHRFQKLRLVVERDDVTSIRVDWWVGSKKGARIHKLKPAKTGPLRVNRNKLGKYAIHLELETPDDKRPLEVHVILETQDGRSVRAELTLQRGRDRDRDGAKDGGKHSGK